jgi:hypothetical protein
MEKGKQKRKSGMRFFSFLLVGVSAVVGLSSVQAAPSLSLSDGRHTMTLNQNAAGIISYNGALGKFSLNITSNPAVGDALLPSLNVSLTSGRGAGSLTLLLSNTSIATLPGQLSAKINGQSTGDVVFSTYGSSSNSMFAMNSTFTSNSLTKGSFNKTSLATVPLKGPFSLTEKILVTPGSRNGSASFTTTVVDPPLAGGNIPTVPDTGSTLLLLGVALGGLLLVHRRLAAQ